MEMILKNGILGVEVDGIFVRAISGGSDFTPSRLGQDNGAGSALALFYKQFAGEVMTTFAANNVMLAKTMVRNIKQGKSAAFPATGVVNAHYHIPGTELTGQTTKATERLISIDSLLVADVFIPNIDEAMAQYEVRSIYSNEAGVSLADQMDLNLLRVVILAARAASTITGLNGGTAITSSTCDVNGAALAAAIYAVAQAFDDKKVPMADRNVAVKPAQYYLMAQNTDLINKDWTGGNGDIAKGTIGSVGGLEVIKSIHVPTTNYAGDAVNEQNTYSGTFNTTIAAAFQKRSVGTVKLLDLAVESEYSVRYQGTLLVGKYAVGHGILRPECSAEIKTA
jgi:hypothetical protein